MITSVKKEFIKYKLWTYTRNRGYLQQLNSQRNQVRKVYTFIL